MEGIYRARIVARENERAARRELRGRAANPGAQDTCHRSALPRPSGGLHLCRAAFDAGAGGALHGLPPSGPATWEYRSSEKRSERGASSCSETVESSRGAVRGGSVTGRGSVGPEKVAHAAGGGAVGGGACPTAFTCEPPRVTPAELTVADLRDPAPEKEEEGSSPFELESLASEARFSRSVEPRMSGRTRVTAGGG